MWYRLLFLLIVFFYALYYAPFGVNETDGGFLTALAWQLENGKVLYRDVVYVRPPLPVWMRYLEMQLLPDAWAALGERWLFYFKAGLYCWLGASVLASGRRRAILAIAGFIVSVHCYPAAAWHTVDGILWATFAVWCWFRQRPGTDILAGAALAAALLCKQSFYPLLALAPLLLLGESGSRVGRAAFGFALALATAAGVLIASDAWVDYWMQTTGAASGGQLLRHGLTDYFRLNPVAVLPAALLLLPVAGKLYARGGTAIRPNIALWCWILALGWLAGAYGWAIYARQEFTLPFAQTRFLCWLAAAYLSAEWGRGRMSWQALRPAVGLLLISWSAAISWGYNLPVLFAVPLIWPVAQISERLWADVFPRETGYRALPWIHASVLIGLLGLFRFAYEFVYRDGPRSRMTAPMGALFPRLHGIYTSPAHRDMYADLKKLSKKYPVFKTLPSFPQANYLCNTPPPLPLDWVVAREIARAQEQVEAAAKRSSPVWFVEKRYANRLSQDEQLKFTQEIVQKGRILEETPHFWVIFSGK